MSFCAAVDTPSPKGQLSPDIGGVMLKGLPERQVEKGMGALVFLLKHSTVSTLLYWQHASTALCPEIMCGEDVDVWSNHGLDLGSAPSWLKGKLY